MSRGKIPGHPTAASSEDDARSVATEALTRRFRVMLDQHDRPGLKTLSPRGNDGAGGQMLLAHLARIKAEDIVECPHIEVEGQEAYFWLASIPTAYLCAGCLTTAPRPIACDHCHRRSGQLERHTLNVGGRAVHVSFLCPTCAAAEEAVTSS